MIAGELVTAAGTELIGGADGAEAVSAVGREMVIALRTEVEIALDMGGACRAAGNFRLAEQEVKHRADAAGHDKADGHPKTGAHSAAGSVFADVTDHEKVEGNEDAAGQAEIDMEAEWRGMVLLLRENNPEIVFDQNKGRNCDHNGPDRDQARVFVHRDVLWIAHRWTRPPGALQKYDAKLKTSLTAIHIDGEDNSEVAFWRLRRKI